MPCIRLRRPSRPRFAAGVVARRRGGRLQVVTVDPRPEIASVFSKVADTYDRVGVRFFSVFGKQLVQDADLRPSDRVLDVGCGGGAALFPAAAAVGPDGSVVGIDLAPGMVDRTAVQIRERGLANVRVEVMDAQEPSLPPGAFDVVTASFVVFFLPDPLAGLRSWHDLLIPGGRLAMTTFAGDDPRFGWQQSVFAPYAPPGIQRPQHTGLFGSTEGVHGLVGQAGFVDQTSTVREHLVVFDSPEHWLSWSMSQGQRAFWDRMSDADRIRVRAQVTNLLQSMAEPDASIVLRQGVRYTLAHRPAGAPIPLAEARPGGSRSS
jgi:ubiquinone/menaquinone biosynthesis C-methylase UbiE